MNWFAAKYGPTILAAPIRGGFDNVAWITPMAVFLLATVGAGFLIRVWKLRAGRRGCMLPVAAGCDAGARCDAGADSQGDGVLMGMIAGVVLTLALFAFIFWPEKNPFVQADKTRVDYLRERKDVIYENLRDLNFEYRLGSIRSRIMRSSGRGWRMRRRG